MRGRRPLLLIASLGAAHALCSGCTGSSSSQEERERAAAQRAATPPVLDGGGTNTASVAAAKPAAPDPELAGLKFAKATITSTLEGALAEQVGAELAPSLTQVAKRVLVWWIDTNDYRKGDTLEIVYETRADQEPLAHALTFRSAKHGKAFEALRVQPTGSPYARWYQPDGEEVELRLKNGPIESYEQITSLLKDGRRHKGVDFKTAVGTPVFAPIDGVVTKMNWAFRANGNSLEIDGGGKQAKLLHLEKIEPGVRPGKAVKRGQVVARSGNTGHSTAPHLHYQLERSKKILDPFDVHETYREKLAAEDRPALDAAIARFTKMKQLQLSAGGTVP